MLRNGVVEIVLIQGCGGLVGDIIHLCSIPAGIIIANVFFIFDWVVVFIIRIGKENNGIVEFGGNIRKFSPCAVKG